MKFRISKDAPRNAGKLLDVRRDLIQWPNGRVEVVGIIHGRSATWSGSLGVDVDTADNEAKAWLHAQTFDRAMHVRWLDATRKEREEAAIKEKARIERVNASWKLEQDIIRAAHQQYTGAVTRGVMMFDGAPQVARVPNQPERHWVQAWVLVELPA